MIEALGITTKEKPFEEHLLYDGSFTLFFNQPDHVYYRLDEEGDLVVIPSATNITGMLDKPALTGWAAKMTTDYIRANFKNDVQYTPESFEELLLAAKKNFRVYTEAAGDTGTIAHDWLERYIRTRLVGMGSGLSVVEPLPRDPRAANGVQAALSFFAEHHVEFILCERKVYSHELDIAGTLDALAIVDGKLAIIDFKTSNSLHRLEYGMQTAFYQQAVMEELSSWLADKFGLAITERWILRLSKEDGSFFEPMYLDERDQIADSACFSSLVDSYRSVQLHADLVRIRKAENKADAKAAKELAKLEEKLAKADLRAKQKAAKRLADEEAKALRKKGQGLKRVRRKAA